MKNDLFCIVDGSICVNGIYIDLPRVIDEAFIYNDLIIFRYAIDGKNITNRNVGALDFNGNLKWLIEEDQSKLDFKEFHKIYLEDNNLIALNWTGMSYKVNVGDGTIKPHKFYK